MTEAEELELLELEEEEAHSARPQPAAADEGPGLFRSLALGFAQGGTKNHADEIGGLVGSATQDDPIQLPGGPKQPTAGQLVKGGMRRELDQALRKHPIATIGAQVAGDLASDWLISKTGVPVTSTPYQLASAFVSGVGGSEDSVAENPGGVVVDGAVNAGLAAATRGALKFGGKAVAPLARFTKGKLRDFAAERAIKATGAIQSDIKGIPGGIDRIRQMGHQLLDQGVITPFASKEAVSKNAATRLEGSGALIGDILDRADQQVAQTGAGAFDWSRVAQRIDAEVTSKLGETGKRTAAGALAFADDIANEAANGGGYAAANRLKGEIQGGINWKTDPKLTQDVAKRIQGILKEEIDGQLGRQLGDQIGGEFTDAKSLHGAFKTASKAAKRAEERELGNRMFSASDYGLGGAGGAVGSLLGVAAGGLAGGGIGALAGPALGLANKFMRERGSSAAAVGMKALSDSDALKQLIRMRPEAMGRFAAPLVDALKSGMKAFAARDYVMSQKIPEYREAKKRGLEEQE